MKGTRPMTAGFRPWAKYLYLTFVIGFPACWTPALAEDSPQHVAVTLLHINDVYEIAPRKGLGGFAGLATLLKRERERAARGQVITTVGGDFLSPSVMSGLTKGA